jgi:hypothetical protein
MRREKLLPFSGDVQVRDVDVFGFVKWRWPPSMAGFIATALAQAKVLIIMRT